MQVSVGFVSLYNLLQHVHTFFSYMPYQESRLTWQVVDLLLWAIVAVMALLYTYITLVLLVLYLIST
jgi:hypothetical protein